MHIPFLATQELNYTACVYLNSVYMQEGGGWGSWWVSHVVKVNVIGLELGLGLVIGLVRVRDKVSDWIGLHAV